jgi:hypothetical protein
MAAKTVRIVQPYGRDEPREATLVSEHRTVADAFAELDRLAAQMIRTGVSPDAVRLIVVDEEGRVVSRPAAH